MVGEISSGLSFGSSKWLERLPQAFSSCRDGAFKNKLTVKLVTGISGLCTLGWLYDIHSI